MDFENVGKTQNCVCSSCEFPDSKDKGYCGICCKTSAELNVSAKSLLHMK